MPRIISHRSNINGPKTFFENSPKQIANVLENTPYDVEIDVWYDKKTNQFYLGHDEPTYTIPQPPEEFFNNPRFWIHAKNYDALSQLMAILPPNIHIFSHDKDPVTLTSTRIPWVYPGYPFDSKSVIVMPELTIGYYSLTNLKEAYAICTDYPNWYHKLTTNSI